MDSQFERSWTASASLLGPFRLPRQCRLPMSRSICSYVFRRLPIACASGNAKPGQNDRPDGAVKERVEIKKQDSMLYKVLLINDDQATMKLVIQVLETVFSKSPAESYPIMMHVHINGSHLAGVYPSDIAEMCG